ncbi:COX15/CtaA family protein [Namhaeicola litoreus]|uniref:COX15/CtaA family protein n=1 Tax=Namhaeicola litoreus TaxID=1052145 RepID=A0ABW3XXY2_9FLAO
MKKSDYLYSRTVRIWLIIGLVMLLGQVILGGITRLTGSGLSITKWDVVTGVIPPMTEQDWLKEFDLYKETPQYQKINSAFDLNEFKYIYFWEFFHRFWVRALGLIFLFPFLYFVFSKKIDGKLVKRLGLVILLTLLTASAGWIMVQSGLVNRPWVNAYKLTLHFILASLTISALVWIIADVYRFGEDAKNVSKKFVQWLIGITFLQLIFAGMMSGMKAGLYYPTWPDMNGQIIPNVLLEIGNWKLENLTNYDSYLFAPALIQFIHRAIAYLLLILTFILFFKYRSKLTDTPLHWIWIVFILINIQVLLGIFTLLNIKGAAIPLFLGVSHQLVGLLFFIGLLFFYFSLRKNRA